MITKSHRFHGRAALTRIYRQGVGARGPIIAMKYLQRRPGSGYRSAVVVSKKVSKLAVKRNRIRRRVFETVRLIESRIGSYDIILTVFDEKIADMPHKELESIIVSLVDKLPAGDLSHGQKGH